MIDCMDCFAIVASRVPGTTICPKCYCDRCTHAHSSMAHRPQKERAWAVLMLWQERRGKELELANRLQREWTPPLSEVLKEAG